MIIHILCLIWYLVSFVSALYSCHFLSLKKAISLQETGGLESVLPSLYMYVWDNSYTDSTTTNDQNASTFLLIFVKLGIGQMIRYSFSWHDVLIEYNYTGLFFFVTLTRQLCNFQCSAEQLCMALYDLSLPAFRGFRDLLFLVLRKVLHERATL